MIALSIGAGVYYYQPKSANIGPTTATVTTIENSGFPLNGTITGNCGNYNSASQQPVQIQLNSTQKAAALKSMWRYFPDGNGLEDLQLAVFVLSPGTFGHICVAYPVAKVLAVKAGVASEPNFSAISFNPVAYNASVFTQNPLLGQGLQITADPNLVTFPFNSPGYLFVNFTLTSNETGYFYYSLPYEEYCDNLPIAVSASPARNFTTANFDQLSNNSLPGKNSVGYHYLYSGDCPGIAPPLGEGSVVSYTGLSITYLTLE